VSTPFAASTTATQPEPPEVGTGSSYVNLAPLPVASTGAQVWTIDMIAVSAYGHSVALLSITSHEVDPVDDRPLLQMFLADSPTDLVIPWQHGLHSKAGAGFVVALAVTPSPPPGLQTSVNVYGRVSGTEDRGAIESAVSFFDRASQGAPLPGQGGFLRLG
jgi:hypothetical protein